MIHSALHIKNYKRMIMMRSKLMFEINYIEINLLSTVSLYYFQVFKYLVIGTKLCLELLQIPKRGG